MAILVLQILLAAALFYSCFCRLVHTNKYTRRELRWTLTLKASASLLVMAAPVLPIISPHDFHWAPWDTPYWVWIAFLAASSLLQMVCAPFWTSSASMKVFQSESTPERIAS